MIDAVALESAAVVVEDDVAAAVVLSFDFLFSVDISIPFIRLASYIYVGIKWYIKPTIGSKILNEPNYFAIIKITALKNLFPVECKYSLNHETEPWKAGKYKQKIILGGKVAGDIQPMPRTVLAYNLIER